MPHRKRATLADVAEVSGLSISAVSMILNDRPGSRLSDEARQKVQAAAEALGYRPNLAARALRTDTTQTIGFVSDLVASTRYASGLIRGALQEAKEMGHFLLVAETGGDDRQQDSAIAAMLDRQVDGLIFASMRAREMELPVMSQKIDFVLLNATSKDFDACVLPDEYNGGKLAIETLIDAGHTDRIALLGESKGKNSKSPFQTITVLRRFAGISDAMAQANLNFLYSEKFDLWEPQEGYDAAKKVLQQPVLPTALLCMNDRIAFGAYQAVQERGLKIPDDISVISFDNDELALYLRPGLTTVALPHVEMGKVAIQRLLGKLPEETSLVTMPLKSRGSLAGPKRH